jgi:hypothetical protein
VALNGWVPRADGTGVDQWRNGTLVGGRDFTAEELAVKAQAAIDGPARLAIVTAEQAILAKIALAIAANARVEADMAAIINGVNTFAAIGAPTTAQRNAFILNLGQGMKMVAQDQQAQARQLTALARHAAQDFTSTTGT